MSLSAALNVSVNSLAAFQGQIRITSANVGNAQNADYTRKIATITTPSVAGLPGAPLIASVARVAAKDVQQDLYRSLAEFGERETQAQLTRDLADILDITNSSSDEQPTLARLLSNFEDSWKDLEANPEDGAAVNEVIRRGQELAAEVNRLYNVQTELRTRANEQVENAVQTINDAAAEIAKLNTQVSAARGADQPTGDFEDLRDVQVKRIAELAGIRTVINDRGELFVYTEAGIQLVGTVAQELDYTPATSTANGTITYAGSTNDLNLGFVNGQIRAVLDYLDPATSALTNTNPNVGTLAKYVNQINSFALNLTEIVNRAYASSEGLIPAPTPIEGTEFFHTYLPAESGFEGQYFAVEADLLNGTDSFRRLSGSEVQQALRGLPTPNPPDPLNDYIVQSSEVNPGGAQANGLQIADVTVFGLMDAIFAYQARNADANATNRDSAERIQHTLDQKYRNITGVDIDSELAGLQVLQNNYAAMANVLTTITRMFDELISIGR